MSRVYWHFQAKVHDQIALNYIPTSCSRAKFLFLVTFLILALTKVYCMATFYLEENIYISFHRLLGSKLLGSRDRRGKEDERRERGDRRRGREGEREGWGEERRRGREGWGEERREDKRWESGEERWGKRPRRDSLEHRYDHTDFRGRH